MSAVFRLPRAVYRASGPDAARYLNGQLTNDVAALAPGTSCAAAATNHKGKLDAALVYVHRLAEPAETFLLDAPPELREELFARLDRYLIADDCTLEDVTDGYAVLHSLDHSETPTSAVHSAPTIRFSRSGHDHLVPAGDASASAPLSEDVEQARIAAGVPAWGAELTPDTLPPEAGLDTFAISYTKGCYIGQEVISRIRSVGRVNRRLHHLTLQGDPASATPGAALVAADQPDKPLGTLTSVGADGRAALGYISPRNASPGDTLHLTDGEKILSTTIEIGNTAPDFPSS